MPSLDKSTARVQAENKQSKTAKACSQQGLKFAGPGTDCVVVVLVVVLVDVLVVLVDVLVVVLVDVVVDVVVAAAAHKPPQKAFRAQTTASSLPLRSPTPCHYRGVTTFASCLPGDRYTVCQISESLQSATSYSIMLHL